MTGSELMKWTSRREGSYGIPGALSSLVTSSQPAVRTHVMLLRPPPLAASPHHGVRLAQVLDATPRFPEGVQGMTQVEAEINGLDARRRTVGEMLEGHEGLFKGRDCLAGGRALKGLGAGLPTVGHGFLPHLAPHGMVG